MTRKKKSRSLKRIHSVKTGNVSKLKRAGTTDRQNSNLKSKAKPKSIYQRFLEDNPEAAEKEKQIQVANAISKTNENSLKAASSDKEIISKDNRSPKKPQDRLSKDETHERRIKESRTEKEPDLLSQLDNKNFNDFY
jgi:hypothetical protein